MADTMNVTHDVKDLGLAPQGKIKIEWADRHMPVLRAIRARFAKEQPLKGAAHRGLPARHHRDREPRAHAQGRRRRGARCAARIPLSHPGRRRRLAGRATTASRRFAIKGEDHKTYYSHIVSCIEARPHITMDDGCDLVTVLHTKTPGLPARRDRRHRGDHDRRHPPARDGGGQGARYPVIAINDADTKHLFDNRYGTGQSTMDGILRCTNMLIAGSTVVIAGYGWCGRGVAMRAKGMGATVLVTEIDPVRALEAAMDGFQVVVDGRGGAARRPVRHRDRQQVGAAPRALRGHEGRRDRREQRPLQRRDRHPGARAHVDEQAHGAPVRRGVPAPTGGKRIYLLGEGRLINLAAAEGHPAMVMDMSFANQALSRRVPDEEGDDAAEGRLHRAEGDRPRGRAAQAQERWASTIDTLTPEQAPTSPTWSEGT